jgi:hypothetical protein
MRLLKVRVKSIMNLNIAPAYSLLEISVLTLGQTELISGNKE